MNLTRLPVDAMVIGFLLAALGIAFIFAFNETTGSTTPSSSPSASASAAASSSTGGGGGGLTVTATDNAFDQTSLTVKAGSAAAITVTNKGQSAHNLHI